MHGVLWQDWTTLRLTGATSAVTQSEPLWLDVVDYRDAIFWLECRQLSVGGAAAAVLAYETSPSKDEVLFRPMSQFPLAVTSAPFIIRIIDARNPTVPLGNWIRWRLFIAGTPTTEWGATLRLHCSLNPSRGR